MDGYNLTDQQWAIIEAIVEGYEGPEAFRWEFVYRLNMEKEGPHIWFGIGGRRGPECDETDLYQLAHERLVTLRNDGGTIWGKPTQAAFEAVAGRKRD